MTVNTFESNDIISVTDSAAEHFRLQIEKKSAKAIRLGLKAAGCTGFKYIIEQVDSPLEKDISIILENGVEVFIDGEHIKEFQGIEVDYKVEGLNRSLVLNNPNVKDACGCGESIAF